MEYMIISLYYSLPSTLYAGRCTRHDQCSILKDQDSQSVAKVLSLWRDSKNKPSASYSLSHLSLKILINNFMSDQTVSSSAMFLSAF